MDISPAHTEDAVSRHIPSCSDCGWHHAAYSLQRWRVKAEAGTSILGGFELRPDACLQIFSAHIRDLMATKFALTSQLLGN